MRILAIVMGGLLLLLAGCPKDGIAGDDGGDDVSGDGGPTGPTPPSAATQGSP